MASKDSKIYKEYCKCRNQVRRLTRKAVKNTEKEIAKNIKKNRKKFWSCDNAKTKVQSPIPELVKSNNNHGKSMTNNDKEKADVLGNFFASVFVKEPEWTWLLDKTDRGDIKKELKVDLTEDRIRKKLQKINSSKSPGPDSLHPRVFKEIAPVLTRPLYIIFDISIKTGKVPSAWKIASITPIFKNKGSKNHAENYRPISLTCIVSKILESVVRDDVLSYFKENGLLSDRQFGFLEGRSTTLQLLTVMEKWIDILDNDGIIDVIFCDFQKAFDKVPHNRLIDVLRYYGIEDPILSWIENFLKQRKQQVNVNGSKSEVFDVLSGVPQGSVLGPLLFVIYINLMIEKANSPNLYLYADDVKTFQRIESTDDINDLQEHIDRLYDWTQYSLLKFHPGKCETMRIKSKYNKSELLTYYSIDETKLNTVNKIKDLGITFDSSLSFETHINMKVNKANQLVGMLRRTFVYLDKNTFKELFVSAMFLSLHFQCFCEILRNP